MTYSMSFFYFKKKKGTFPFPLPPRLNIYSSSCSFGIFFIFVDKFVQTEGAFSIAMYNKRFIF